MACDVSSKLRRWILLVSRVFLPFFYFVDSIHKVAGSVSGFNLKSCWIRIRIQSTKLLDPDSIHKVAGSGSGFNPQSCCIRIRIQSTKLQDPDSIHKLAGSGSGFIAMTELLYIFNNPNTKQCSRHPVSLSGRLAFLMTQIQKGGPSCCHLEAPQIGTGGRH